jgi:hypothetical protein
MLAAACSAPPDAAQPNPEVDESVHPTTVNVDEPPTGKCVLLDGRDGRSVEGETLRFYVRQSPYSGTDPTYLAFFHELAALGATDSIGLSGVPYSSLAMDVTNVDPDLAVAITREYANSLPVFAGYFHCSYDWPSATQGPGPSSPRIEKRVIVYSVWNRPVPKGCNGCNPSAQGHIGAPTIRLVPWS